MHGPKRKGCVPLCASTLRPLLPSSHRSELAHCVLTDVHSLLDLVIGGETGHRVGHLTQKGTSETIVETLDTCEWSAMAAWGHVPSVAMVFFMDAIIRLSLDVWRRTLVRSRGWVTDAAMEAATPGLFVSSRGPVYREGRRDSPPSQKGYGFGLAAATTGFSTAATTASLSALIVSRLGGWESGVVEEW